MTFHLLNCTHKSLFLFYFKDIVGLVDLMGHGDLELGLTIHLHPIKVDGSFWWLFYTYEGVQKRG